MVSIYHPQSSSSTTTRTRTIPKFRDLALKHLIGVDIDRNLDIVGKRQFLKNRSCAVTRLANRFCANENLEPVVAFRTLDGGWHDGVESCSRARLLGQTPMDRFCGEFGAAPMS